MNQKPPVGRRGSTTSQLRDDVDSGRTGDKVGVDDPAAAPLGTDAEAAGTPLSPDDVELARSTQRGAGGQDRADVYGNSDADSDRSSSPTRILAFAAIAIVLLVLVVIAFVLGVL